MGMASKVSQYLGAHPVTYDVVNHPHSNTSIESARASHVPADSLAKAVVLEDDAQRVMAVLPASHRVSLSTLRDCMGRPVRLASEAELKTVFGDCALGAIPPLGCVYGMETIWDDSLMERPDIYFEAGDHETLVHMKTRDFITLMGGSRHMPFSAPL